MQTLVTAVIPRSRSPEEPSPPANLARGTRQDVPVADTRLGMVLQGRYRITARIAEGGMGIVYRAQRIGIEREVAIKFLNDVTTVDAAARRRFEIEAKAASRMHHPSCAPVIDFGTAEGVPYIVMELVEGVTLRKIIQQRALSVPRALAFARQVLAGLAHAHQRGIIHRDIKPENIIITSDAEGERAVLTDFGLARFVDQPGVSQDIAIGTPSYMAPEQTLGLAVDARTDVYGAGVLLFELLTGQKPFRAARPFDVMQMHREMPLPTFDEVAADRAIPPAIEGVVRTALEKTPDARYPSAAELATALERASSSAHDDTAAEPLAALLAASGARSWHWLVVLVLLAGLSAAAYTLLG